MSTLAPSKSLVDTQVLTVTTEAATRIKSLMAEKGLAEHALRVFVAGGGCSGFQYGMAFDNHPQESDHIVEAGGVRLVVDAMSLPYLLGSHIDFVDSVMGGGFRIDNPNAVSTCACGNSAGHASDEGGSCNCH